MQTGRTSLLKKLGRGISWAALALAISFGSSGFVRAGDPEVSAVSLQEIITPVVSAVMQLDQAVGSIRSAVDAFEESFHSKRIATRELCISDESGAETCITKAQLDAFLKSQADAQASVVLKSDAHAPAAVDSEDVTQPPAGVDAAAAPQDDAVIPQEEEGDFELDATGSIAPQSGVEPSPVEPSPTAPGADETSPVETTPAETSPVESPVAPSLISPDDC
jgi:hypothetical protein